MLFLIFLSGDHPCQNDEVHLLLVSSWQYLLGVDSGCSAKADFTFKLVASGGKEGQTVLSVVNSSVD